MVAETPRAVKDVAKGATTDEMKAVVRPDLTALGLTHEVKAAMKDAAEADVAVAADVAAETRQRKAKAVTWPSRSTARPRLASKTRSPNSARSAAPALNVAVVANEANVRIRATGTAGGIADPVTPAAATPQWRKSLPRSQQNQAS
jgi:hypothetical protein